MDEQQRRASDTRKRPDVCKNGLIGGTVFERDKNVLIHDGNDEARMTNDEKMVEAQVTDTQSRFGLLVSSFLRHSSFVIVSLHWRRKTEKIIERFKYRVWQERVQQQFY